MSALRCSLIASICLAACGGDDGVRHLGDAGGTDGALGPQVAPGIYLTLANGTILAFALDATGDAAPFRTIAGASTMLSLPIGLAVDHAGNVYAANRTGSGVTVYAPGTAGDAAPIRTLTAPGMLSPQGLVRGPDDDMYVSTCPTCGTSAGGDVGIYHFPRDAAATDFTITGAALTVPSSPALAADGSLVVGNSFNGAVVTYAAGAHGDAAPARSFTPQAQNLQSLALGASTIALASPDHGVQLYARDASGAAAPVATLDLSTIGLGYPGGLFFDTSVSPTVLYLADYGSGSVHVIELAGTEPAWTVAASHTIAGATTMLDQPLDITVVR